MAGIRHEGDFINTIERQTTYGTPVDTAPIGLNTADLRIIMPGDDHVVPVDRGVRMDHEADEYVDTAATFPTATLSCPLTSGLLKTLLPGLLQKTTDWSPTGSVYDMYPVQTIATTPLLRTSNEGYFYTLTRRSPTASQSERITDAIPRSLKITLHPTNNGGLLWSEWEFIGTTYSHSANPSGSVTFDSLSATTRYSWGDLDSVTYDGGSSILNDFISLELDLTWNVKFAGDTSRGQVTFPKFESNATLVAGQNSVTQACEALSRAAAISTGRALVLTWGDGTVSSAGELNLTCFTKVKPDGFDDSDRGEGEIHTVQFKNFIGAGATEYPVRFQFYAA